MGFLHTRRYIIDANPTEIVDYALAYVRDDEEAVEELLRERSKPDQGDAVLMASQILTNSADVGDNTDIVKVYDEWTEDVGNRNDVYFEDERAARHVFVEDMKRATMAFDQSTCTCGEFAGTSVRYTDCPVHTPSQDSLQTLYAPEQYGINQ